jgi:hypothetical protein
VRSVSQQVTGYDARGEGRQVVHWYSASDEATANDARSVEHLRPWSVNMITGSPLERLVPFWLSLDPADVVIWLDGDDELEPGAVERVARFHEFEDVWLTYGSFVRDDGVPDFAWVPCYGRRYEGPPRSSRFRATHLRTFRAGLFASMAPDCLRDPRGEYFAASPDVAVMTALLELAGPRYLVSTDVLCRYNYAHSARDAGSIGAQMRDVADIGKIPPLKPLPARPW